MDTKYIVIDPSGSYNEGKGHTGMTLIKNENWTTLEVKSFAAKDYPNRTAYWTAVIKTITEEAKKGHIEVIIESFMIRSTGFLMGKMPETIQFIGAIAYICELRGIKYTTQAPTTAKSRFKDELLGMYIPNYEIKFDGRKNNYYLNGKIINDHIRDSLKHLLFYFKYRKDK